ncbi:MAG: chemotaxis protein CheW [Dehalococcoidia bacterium]|nr:chemotaxis protein CheW [Dehalococcoidia bacterium]
MDNSMNEIQQVVFDLASEHYGVDISDVREIMRMQNITKVPGAVSYVEGVINLRGKVLPVLDLRKRLGLKVAEQSEESRIVVVDIADGEVGVIVDAVTEVLRVPNSSIEPPSSMVAQGNSDYLRGIAKLTGRLIILLDLNKLLSSKADADMIARVIGDSMSAVQQQGSDMEPSVEKVSRNGKKKAGDTPGKNNGKECAVA